MSDSSIHAERKVNGSRVNADVEYRTEMVSPICRYEDIVTIQEIIRKLKEHGALTNKSCGIHVHINAERLMPELSVISPISWHPRKT